VVLCKRLFLWIQPICEREQLLDRPKIQPIAVAVFSLVCEHKDESGLMTRYGEGRSLGSMAIGGGHT
jgi:hypothetical protein